MPCQISRLTYICRGLSTSAAFKKRLKITVPKFNSLTVQPAKVDAKLNQELRQKFLCPEETEIVGSRLGNSKAESCAYFQANYDFLQGPYAENESNWKSLVENDAKLDKLCVGLKDLSFQDLQECVFTLSDLKVSQKSSSVDKFVQELGHCCQSWLLKKSHEKTTSVDVVDKVTFLRMAFMWPLVLMDFNHKFASWQDFVTLLCATLLSPDHIKCLDQDEFVFCLFLSGCLRTFPLLESNKRLSGGVSHGGYEIPFHIDHKVCQCLSKVDLDEVGIIAHALHQMFFTLYAHNGEMHRLFLHALLKVPDNEGTILSILKVVRDRGRFENDYVDKIMATYTPLLDRYDHKVKVRLLQVISSGLPVKPQLFLDTFVESMIKKNDLFCGAQLKTLEPIPQALFNMNYDDKKKATYELLLKALNQSSRQDPRTGRSFVYANACLAKCGVVHEDNLSQIFEAVNSRSELFLACNTKQQTLEVGVEALFSLKRPPSSSSEQDKKAFEIKRAVHLNLNALFHIAELDCNLELDYPDYKGPRLQAQLREIFLDIKAKPREQKIRDLVHRDLIEIMGKPSRVYYGYLMPHSSFKEALLCLHNGHQDLFGLDISEEFCQQLDSNDGQFKRPPTVTGGSFMAIVVPTSSKFSSDGVLCGSVQHKVSQLKKLGYNVMVLQTYKKYFRLDKGGGGHYYSLNYLKKPIWWAHCETLKKTKLNKQY